MQSEDKLDKIFRLQSALQAHLGTHPDALDDKALIEYVKMNVLALTDELHEALGEVNWKNWTTSYPSFRDKDKFAAELCDVAHFFVNLCLAARMSASDLLSRYEEKNKKNHERRNRGYTGNDKCDQCKRELDDPLMPVRHATIGSAQFRFCSSSCLGTFTEEMDATQE